MKYLKLNVNEMLVTGYNTLTDSVVDVLDFK
jgi:hypothetical protein